MITINDICTNHLIKLRDGTLCFFMKENELEHEPLDNYLWTIKNGEISPVKEISAYEKDTFKYWSINYFTDSKLNSNSIRPYIHSFDIVGIKFMPSQVDVINQIVKGVGEDFKWNYEFNCRDVESVEDLF